MVAALLFGGSLAAQTVLINDDFESYPLGGRIAESAIAAGNDWWTTWYNHPGSTTEDGVIAEAGGTQCGYISGSNDNVLLLGGQESGTYDLEFAIFCDEGKYGYFNILHEFNGNGSTWAMQAYVNATNDGNNSTVYSVGHGTVHAGANANADIPAVVNEWMYFRIRVDLDADVAELFYRSETTQPEEISIVSWQWSKDSFGQSVVGRKMDAMDFFAPHATLGCYYLDNFKYTRIGEETAASLDFDTEEVNLWVMEDDFTSVDINISNAAGTSIGDWAAWTLAKAKVVPRLTKSITTLSLIPRPVLTSLAHACLLKAQFWSKLVPCSRVLPMLALLWVRNSSAFNTLSSTG